MAFEIVIPRLGWSMDEGTFVDWLKQDGETVRSGDSLFVLEGEKAEQEVESFDSGILHILPGGPRPGDVVAVGALLGYLLAEGEEPPEPTAGRAAATPMSAPAQTAPAQTATAQTAPAQTDPSQVAVRELLAASSSGGPAARRRAREAVGGGAWDPASPASDRRAVTPRARRAAKIAGVNLDQVVGSGRNGRIRERDVLAKSGYALPSDGVLEPHSRMRLAIAQRMLAGVQETAPVTLTTTANANQLVAHREELKNTLGDQAPGYNDMIVKLAGLTLRDHGELNVAWSPQGMVRRQKIHVAVAVESGAGLLAPVIRDVDELELVEVAAQIRAAADRAQEGRMRNDELTGGSLTITNLGALGVEHFTPIINLPQAAILGVGALREEPAIEDGAVVPQWRLYLSLTFDHRILDGAPAARWLAQLVECITDPGRFLNQV